MTVYEQLNALEALDLYFIENRARLLDVAAFLDRIDRYPGADEARRDFRYGALRKVLGILCQVDTDRTRAIQLALSDPTTAPLESAVGLKATGAWPGGAHEGD